MENTESAMKLLPIVEKEGALLFMARDSFKLAGCEDGWNTLYLLDS